MRYSRLSLVLLASGCGEAPQPPAAPVAVPIAAISVPTAAPASAPEKPPPSANANDLGSNAVRQTLMPMVPVEPLVASVHPVPRESEIDRGDIPAKLLPFAIPPTGMPPSKPVRLSPPKEVAPSDLGNRTEKRKIQTPYQPLVKAPSPYNPGAADVGPLVRMLPDKASTDDPTADLLAKKAIETPMPLPAEPLPFLKLTIPNPFEYAEQLKGETGRDAKFATSPSLVNPEKR